MTETSIFKVEIIGHMHNNNNRAIELADETTQNYKSNEVKTRSRKLKQLDNFRQIYKT